VSVALLYLFGLLALLLVLPLDLAAHLLPKKPLGWAAHLVLSALSLGLGIGSAFFLLGALIRRLHDRGKSGWWLLLFFGPHIALVYTLSQMALSQQDLILVLVIGGPLLDAPFLAWGMVEILMLRGTAGPNRFGLDPLAQRDAPASDAKAGPLVE
jgi:uncharacterized membrane protein YhaH (DUF805 family)